MQHFCSCHGCAELHENEEKLAEENCGQIWAPQAGCPAGMDNMAPKPALQEAWDLHTDLHVALETSDFLPTLSSPSNTLIPYINSPS